MSDWYDCIEPEVRKAVRLLRNAGLNTTCSCGHDMSIDGAPAVDGELQQIHNVLFNNGLYPYHVEFHLYVDADGLQNALWRVMFREDGEPQVQGTIVSLASGGKALVDSTIADLVQGINDAGIQTVASCSGHGKMPGVISLADGRELHIHPDYDTARSVERLMLSEGLASPIGIPDLEK